MIHQVKLDWKFVLSYLWFKLKLYLEFYIIHFLSSYSIHCFNPFYTHSAKYILLPIFETYYSLHNCSKIMFLKVVLLCLMILMLELKIQLVDLLLIFVMIEHHFFIILLFNKIVAENFSLLLFIGAEVFGEVFWNLVHKMVVFNLFILKLLCFIKVRIFTMAQLFIHVTIFLLAFPKLPLLEPKKISIAFFSIYVIFIQAVFYTFQVEEFDLIYF